MNEAILYQANQTAIEPSSLPLDARLKSSSLSFLLIVLFTIAIYARPEDIFPGLAHFHLTLILGLCAGLTYLGSLLLGNLPLMWSTELRVLLLLTACYVVGVPFAYWRSGSLAVLTGVWLKTLIIFILLTQTLLTLDRVRKILWAIILSELLVCAYSVMQSSSVIWVDQRLMGVNLGILGWNFLGLAAALTIPYIAAVYISQPGLFKRAVLICSFLFMMWMLVLTASRSGFLNVLFSVVLTCLVVLRGSSRGKFIGVGIVLIAIAAICMAPGVFWERMSTVWSDSVSSQNEIAASAKMSEEDRLGALKRSIDYTLQHPLLGLGLGNFEVASGTEIGRPEAWIGAHNTFAEISSEAGIPALALFVFLLWTATRRMKALGKTSVSSPEGLELRLMARATCVSLFSFVFGAFFAHIAYEYYLYYPVAIAVGIQSIARTTPENLDSTRQPATPEPQTIAMDWST